MATTEKEEDYDIQQFLVTAQNPFRNTTYGQTFLKLKQQYNIVLIGLVKTEDGVHNLHKLPKDQMMIEKGDFLLAIVNGETAEKISGDFGVKEGTIL